MAQEVKMLRAQMLVHSHLYYERDSPVISDHEWTARAQRLKRLQDAWCVKRGIARVEIGFFDDAFADWDGSTGHHLPLRHPWVNDKAAIVLDRSRQ